MGVHLATRLAQEKSNEKGDEAYGTETEIMGRGLKEWKAK